MDRRTQGQGRHAGMQACRHACIHAMPCHAMRQRDRQTGRQAGRQTDRHGNTLTCRLPPPLPSPPLRGPGATDGRRKFATPWRGTSLRMVWAIPPLPLISMLNRNIWRQCCAGFLRTKVRNRIPHTRSTLKLGAGGGERPECGSVDALGTANVPPGHFR